MIGPDELRAKIEQYEAQQAALALRERNLKAELEAVQQNLFAVVGAIQDAEHWLKESEQNNGRPTENG